ncbi:unnamed protein product [Callosobruchus maculatus]|uniref:lysoplasmalogenase n=1 Tax=Callosobruchus maculatus TaxID=64391 RepID=A0A653D9E8_CALMS|nr:unnamed protein product [Callosobruchus maculatus]
MSFVDEQENTHSLLTKSPQERKLSYRNLIDKIDELEKSGDTGLGAATELRGVVQEANALDSECSIDNRIEHSDETLLDCLVISSASGLLKKCVESVDVFVDTYEQIEFANNIQAYIKSDDNDEIQDDDILKLIDDARTVIPRIPAYNFIYGSYNLEQIPQPKPKKQKEIIPKRNKQAPQKKEPERIQNVEKEEEGIEEIVKLLYDVLSTKCSQNDGQPIKYYDYIIDTDSFAATLENMFYFAFLIRDGKAGIDLDSNGEPIIKLMRSKTLSEFRAAGGVNAQIISNISMDQWKVKNVGPKLVPFFKTVAIYFVIFIPQDKPSIFSTILKCLPILSLMLFVLLHGMSLGEEYKYSRRILSGLIFCCIGDALLVWNQYFDIGMFAFIIGHIYYILAFGFKPLNLSLGLALYLLGSLGSLDVEQVVYVCREYTLRIIRFAHWHRQVQVQH